MKKRIHPPKWPLKFLSWFCPEELLEEIEGDLYQQFHRDLIRYSIDKSKRRFVWSAMSFFRPGIIRRNKFSTQSSAMIGNYFKIASRVIVRNQVFSIINVSGLVLGITSALLMYLWIQNEFSYDNYHKDIDRIYKAYNQTTINNEIRSWDYTPRVLAPTLKEDFSFVEKAASFAVYEEKFLFISDDKKIINDKGIFTDPELLSIFTFDYLAGSSETALSNPNSIVFTKSFAKKLFGESPAMGKNVTIDYYGEKFPFEITAVLEDLPSNTEFSFDYLISFHFLESIYGKEENWGNNSVRTYVKLKEKVDLSFANFNVKDIAKNHTDKGEEPIVFLYPVSRVHLYGQFENGIESGGRIQIISMLIALACLLVAVACINFINLSTARAQKRSQEIGVRKVIGANRSSLISQFLFESLIIVLLAGLISLLLAYLLLPAFNGLILQDLAFPAGQISFWMIYVGFLIVISLAAGLYPAIYLSALRPKATLKSEISNDGRSGKSFIRRFLVVTQFGFSVILIFSTIVIQNQIRFVQERQAGYNMENLIYHPLTTQIDKHFEAYKNELISAGLVKSITRTSAPITESMSNTYDMQWKGKQPGASILIDRFIIEEDIALTTGIDVIKGREIDIYKYPSDSNAVMLNEAAVKAMEFSDPIGEVIIDSNREWEVVGVVKDFVLTSPHQEVPPIVLQRGTSVWFNVIHLRLAGRATVGDELVRISEIFSKYDPLYPFDYHFVEEVYATKFTGIRKTLAISSVFGSIILFIACCGLFALSLYIIESRIKEVGVRKVFGGTILDIVKLLSWTSLRPVLISILLFSPLAWISMQWWLQSFKYRIELSPVDIILAGVLMTLLALTTVIVQIVRAARTNPSAILKSE